MGCKDVQELLSPYIDNVLSPEEMKQVSEHLEECSECREEYVSLLNTVKEVNKLEDVEPPQDFHNKLIENLEENKPKKIGFKSWKPIGALAAGLIVIVMSLSFLSSDLGVFQGKMQSADDSAVPEMESSSMPEDGGGVGIASQSSEKLGAVNEDAAARDSQEQAEEDAAGIQGQQDYAERKVIKNAFIHLEVKDFDTASSKIASLADSVGGYVQSSNSRIEESSNGDTKRGNITIRVPSNRFNDVLTSVSGTGDVLEKNVSGSDVTMEYYDTEARLNVLQKKEERLLELLDQANKMEDIIQIEDKLSEVRGQIEQLQGRLKYLQDRVSMSVIEISIREKSNPDDKITGLGLDNLWGRTTAAFVSSFNGLIKLLGEGIVGLGYQLPRIIAIIIVGTGLFLIFKAYLKLRS